MAIERRTQQDLCPARRSTFSLSLYAEPERAVAPFIDHAHKVACSTTFRKLGSLPARCRDDRRSERFALRHLPSAGRNQLHLCRALRLEDPAATVKDHHNVNTLWAALQSSRSLSSAEIIGLMARTDQEPFAAMGSPKQEVILLGRSRIPARVTILSRSTLPYRSEKGDSP